MLVRLLGVAEVLADGGWTTAGPPKQSCVLAALAMSPGEAVPITELTERLWGADPPASAHGIVYAHVARLRRLLPDGAELRRAGRDGYRLDIDPQLVDVFQMRSHAAARRWTEALALWRGTPLSGIPGEWARRARETLDRERLAAHAGRFEAELAAGRHTDVIGELYELIAAHPLAEDLVAFLMTALRRSGRDAEALACFAELRERLREELGADPSARVQRIHEQILRREPESEAGTRPVPAQLPADTPVFTGRDAAVEAVLAARRAGAGVIVVDGMAGVGKTALAVHVAHRLAAEYPDGRLFLDLHGFTGGMPGVEPAEALDRMLRALGVPGTRIPPGADARAAEYRSELAGRRMLILLDNAADAGQVRPLLPGDAGNLVLVTSRRGLTDLTEVAAVSLDALDVPDAGRLFTAIAGAGRCRRPETIAAIAGACGGLPLALRVAASRLRSRPQWSAEDLLERLSGELGRHGVASAFDVSYQELDDEHRDMFAHLGLLGGSDVDTYTAAALTGAGAGRAGELLEGLVDEHLLQSWEPGRYRFHDLIRRHAAEKAPEARREAVRRMLVHYRHTAFRAQRLIDPQGQLALDAEPEVPGTGELPLTSDADAAAWFDAERYNLLAAVDAALAEGLDEFAWQITRYSWIYRELRWDGEGQVAFATRGLTGARRSGDVYAEARMLNTLGVAHSHLRSFARAVDTYEQALPLYRRLGNAHGEAAVEHNLGALCENTGEFRKGIEHYRRSAGLAEKAGVPMAVANTLSNAGYTLTVVGEVEEAIAMLREAADICREHGNQWALERVLNHLGTAHRFQGDLAEAERLHREALVFSERHEFPYGLAIILSNLAADLRETGRTGEALEHHRRAMLTCREVHDPLLEATVLNEFGRSHLASGDASAAAACHERAASLAASLGARYELARAHHGLADALGTGIPEGVGHRETAAGLYAECGVPPSVSGIGTGAGA